MDECPGDQKQLCRNCGTDLQGDFCSSCGQRVADFRRPIYQLAKDFVTETLDFDGRAASTLYTLFRFPGKLTQAFLAGQRLTYTSPVRLYLIISILFFVVIAWVAKQGYLLDPGQTVSGDAALQARFASELLPRLMFVLLPIFALLLKMVLPKRLYFDHIIFSLHIHSAMFFILILILPLEKVASENLYALVAQVLCFLYLLVYFLVAIKRTYEINWLSTGLKSVAVLFGYLVVLSLFIEHTSNFAIISD